jgi:hypothetical protein
VQEATIRGDDPDGRLGTVREGPRIGQLATEVETTEEGEHIPEWRTLATTQLLREREIRGWVQQRRRASPVTAGWREQKDLGLNHASGKYRWERALR